MVMQAPASKWLPLSIESAIVSVSESLDRLGVNLGEQLDRPTLVLPVRAVFYETEYPGSYWDMMF
jgi:hypothetical protein